MFFLFESVTKVSAIWIRTLSDYKPQIELGYSVTVQLAPRV